MKYVVTFEPTGPGVEPAMRLKHLLKLAGRACGLRCTALREDGDTAPKPHNARQLPLEVARAGTDGHQRHADAPGSRQVAEASTWPAPDARSAPQRGFDTVRGQDASQRPPDGLASILATSRDIEDSETSEGAGPL